MSREVVIAHGAPYEQMGMLRRLWYRFRRRPLTIKTINAALNRHSVCIGVSGLGKSRLLVQYANAMIARGWNLVVFDVSDSWRQILWYCSDARVHARQSGCGAHALERAVSRGRGRPEPKYWGIAHQREHAIAELTNQGRRELMWRVRSADRIDLYLARVANVEDYDVPRYVEDAYRRASARLHSNE